MGGDSLFPDYDDDKGLGNDNEGTPRESTNPSVSSGDEEGFSTEPENCGSSTNEESGLNFEGIRYSLAAERQRLNIYAQILTCYEGSQPPIERVYEAKSKILSCTQIDRAGEHNIPDAATLLLIGPKGSGKSSLINKISGAFEDNTVRSDRAQVSYNSCPGDGTYFLREYVIPKVSGSLRLYDTRGLSFDSSENRKMIERWMTKGVRHGELVARTSDDPVLKAQLKSKAQRSTCSSPFRTVNYVIFVVNGVSVLESMDIGINEKKRRYLQMIAENFKNPLLSYKDEKPVVVLTHGDLLTVSDRVRVRLLLGDVLCVHPRTHIFDIPENEGLGTKLEIFEMLLHCLEHADINLPACGFNKVRFALVISFPMIIVFVAIIFKIIFNVQNYMHRKPVEASQNIEWHKIRHLWSE